MSKHTCKLGFLSKSDGSALYSLGNTVVLASVNGPLSCKQSVRKYNQSHLEVVYNTSKGQSMIAERAQESLIAHTIEQALMSRVHPRTSINITLQEMQSDGLTLSTSINASCMALLDAGIQMTSCFAAVTCCVTTERTVIVEPEEFHIQESVALLTFVFDSRDYKLLTCHQEGKLDAQIFSSCMTKCQTTSLDVFSFYRRILDEKYQCLPNH